MIFARFLSNWELINSSLVDRYVTQIYLCSRNSQTFIMKSQKPETSKNKLKIALLADYNNCES